MKRTSLILVAALLTLSSRDLSASVSTNALLEPEDFISEIVAVKYAKASDLAGLLEGTNEATPTIRSHFGERLRQVVAAEGIDRKLQTMGSRQVVTDERSNSLLLRTSKREMGELKAIISRRDFVLAQILVEAVIIEFPVKDSTEPSPIEGQPLPGLTALNNLGLVVNTTFPFQQTNGFGQPIHGASYLAILRGDLDSAINALPTNSGVKILQRPRIQTSEGEPAQLFAGTNRPYPRGAYYSGGCFCYSSIQNVNIGTSFEVTCLFPAKDLIHLDINTTTEIANGTVTITNVGEVPVTKREESRAQTFVRDGEVFAIGGILETNKVSIFSEVDLLDRIPGGGYLNKLITYPKHKTRSELVILIRGTMLPTPEVAATQSKDAMPRIRPREIEAH